MSALVRLGTMSALFGVGTKSALFGVDTKSSLFGVDTMSALFGVGTKSSLFRVGTKSALFGVDTMSALLGVSTKSALFRVGTKSALVFRLLVETLLSTRHAHADVFSRCVVGMRRLSQQKCGAFMDAPPRRRKHKISQGMKFLTGEETCDTLGGGRWRQTNKQMDNTDA